MKNGEIRVQPARERGVREGVERRLQGGRGSGGGPGGHVCTRGPAPRRPTHDARVAGATLRLHGSRGRTNRPPSTQPACKSMGVLFSMQVEHRANLEGGGGTSGQPGRDDGAVRGCDDANLAHCAFNPAPRGKSPLGLTTPPTTPRKRWGKGQQSPA